LIPQWKTVSSLPSCKGTLDPQNECSKTRLEDTVKTNFALILIITKAKKIISLCANILGLSIRGLEIFRDVPESFLSSQSHKSFLSESSKVFSSRVMTWSGRVRVESQEQSSHFESLVCKFESMSSQIIISIILVYFRLVVHTDAITDTRAQKMVSHTVAQFAHDQHVEEKTLHHHPNCIVIHKWNFTFFLWLFHAMKWRPACYEMAPDKLENGDQCCFSKFDCRLFLPKFFQFTFYLSLSLSVISKSLAQPGCKCCKLSLSVALNVWFTKNGMCRKKNTHIYLWRKQAEIEWAWRVIFIVACCHSVKLRWPDELFLTPALAPVPKQVTPAPAPAPELIGNLHSDSCLHSESLKPESMLPQGYVNPGRVSFQLGLYFLCHAQVLTDLSNPSTERNGLRPSNCVDHLAAPSHIYATPRVETGQCSRDVYLQFRAVPREHWLICNTNVLKASLKLQWRKSDPPFVIRLYAQSNKKQICIHSWFY